MMANKVAVLIYVSLLLVFTTIDAAVLHVAPGDSIQAAVNLAEEGDMVLVQSGTYEGEPDSDYGVRVTTNGLRLLGTGQVNLVPASDGSNQVGIFISPPTIPEEDQLCDYYNSVNGRPDGTDDCGGAWLHGATIEGFTVQGFPGNGIQTRWVDGFTISRCKSIDNELNGLYATISKNGVVNNCFSSGSFGTALWASHCMNVELSNNELMHAPTGLEITVSNQIWIHHNFVHDNTVGIGLYHPRASGNPPMEEMADWIVEKNKVYNNNYQNTAGEGSFEALVPSGLGIFLFGVSGHVVSQNDIQGNNIAGVALVGYCTGIAIPGQNDRTCDVAGIPEEDPSVKNNEIIKNRFKGNGLELPEGFPLPNGADVLFLYTDPIESGEGTCFEKNRAPSGDVTFLAFADIATSCA
mmetsp:Transcript_27047/g.45057  ORF Transcript_27047/g.45057 Transcript_27047/m.45057 type:complete len:409 (-) Transcript_27047:138-1364(-)